MKRCQKLQGGIHMGNIFGFMDKFYEPEEKPKEEG